LRGMLRNAMVVLGNQMSKKEAVLDHDKVAQAIDGAVCNQPDAVVREHAVWATVNGNRHEH
jgi:hypothetical protein